VLPGYAVGGPGWLVGNQASSLTDDRAPACRTAWRRGPLAGAARAAAPWKKPAAGC